MALRSKPFAATATVAGGADVLVCAAAFDILRRYGTFCSGAGYSRYVHSQFLGAFAREQ